MKFFSPDFDDFKPMPSVFTCEGENHNPSFIIEDVPNGTKELILICHDPDAISGSDWTHWQVTGISPKTAEISDKKLPPGSKVGVSSFGQSTYGGPCPPVGSGPHRYIFSLYAVNQEGSYGDDSSRDDVLKSISGHILAQATWTGVYQRADPRQ